MRMANEHRKNTVILSAWVDPALREHARLEAQRAGVQFSKFIERAVQQAVAKAAVERATRDAATREAMRSRAGKGDDT